MLMSWIRAPEFALVQNEVLSMLICHSWLVLHRYVSSQADGVIPLHLDPSIKAADCRVPGTLRLMVHDAAPALSWPVGSLLVGDHNLGCADFRIMIWNGTLD